MGRGFLALAFELVPGLRSASRFVLTLLVSLTLAFFLLRAAPGDPVDQLVPEDAGVELRREVAAQLGLDKSLGHQYFSFLGRTISFDFGYSFRYPDKEVGQLLRDALGSTLTLAITSLLVAWCIGLVLGFTAARFSSGVRDKVLGVLATLGLALPTVWLGPILILMFALWLPWLPMPGDRAGFSTLVLPVATLASALMAAIFRQVRGNMIVEGRKTYVKAAIARGFSRKKAMFRHALPNALLPVITVAAAQLAAMIGGAVVVETIFARRGIGSLFLEAFYARDYPVIEACFSLSVVFYVLINALLHTLQRFIDPRVS